jgi:multiple sugar transport system substrate-binding protein
MMITRREFNLLTGAVLAAPSMLIEACGGASQPTSSANLIKKNTAAADMQMTWWGNADRAKRTKQVIDAFVQKNPQYKIADVWGPNSSYFDKLNTQIASGSPPDIFAMDMKYIATYAAKNVLVDLTRFASDNLDLADFDPSLVRAVKTKEGMFGLPNALNMFAMLHNQALIAKANSNPPASDLTWQQFADYCRTLSKNLPRNTWPVDDHSGAIAPFEGWVHAAGYELYTADGKLGYPKSVALDWFNYWNDLRKAGAAVPADVSAAATNAASQSASVLATGKAATIMTHSNFLGQYQPLMKDKLGIGPYPKGKRPSQYPKVSQLWCVSAKSKSQSQAVQFLNFYTNDPDAQKASGVERGAPPALKARTLIAPTLGSDNKAELDYVEQFSKGTTPRTTFDPPGALDVTNALMQAAQSIGLGGTSVSAATDKFWSEANSAVK